MEHIVILNHTKETKNTQVYSTTFEAAVVSQLYIKKSAFDGEVPKSIKVTINDSFVS